LPSLSQHRVLGKNDEEPLYIAYNNLLLATQQQSCYYLQSSAPKKSAIHIMAISKPTQSAKNVLFHQPKSVINQLAHGDRRQDKARKTSDRAATRQPASVNQAIRAEPLNPPRTRSKTPIVQKTPTVHLDLWVQPVIKTELQRLATQEGLTMSATGAALLEAALRQKLHIQQGVLLQPLVKQAIREQMQGLSNRLAWLMARNVFTSEHTKSLVTNILGRQPGMTEETLKTIFRMTREAAHSSLTRRTPELEELIDAVKKFLDAEEDR
jgi:hypothetical protein